MRKTVLFTLPLAFLAGCGGGGSRSDATTEADLKRITRLIEESAIGSDIALLDPKSKETVLFSSPYVLSEIRGQLPMTLSESDWQRLLDANVAQEIVMIAVISGNSVSGVGYLGPEFDVVPGAWICTPGSTVRVTKTDSQRPFVVSPSRK